MEEVFDAFDKAYENSFKVKKDFEYSTENSNPELNVVKSVLDEYPDLKAGFDNAVDGEEQTHFAACIVYSKHKELGRETKALKNNDYNLSQIRNATFRERVRNADIPSLDFDSDGCEEDFTDDNYRL
jgi:outer membrane receptor for ferric coprogen and ferric-rhodotorulic acid